MTEAEKLVQLVEDGKVQQQQANEERLKREQAEKEQENMKVLRRVMGLEG